MPIAIFGISNDGLNLAVSLFIMFLVAVYVALVAYTYMDARRRIDDPVLVACATVASLIPFVGTAVYLILRPPEFLEDARERELEIKAAELRVRQLSELSCPNCGYPVEKNYLRCPDCQRRLKDPCQSCGKPVDPRWALCPYCETPLPGRAKRPQRPPEGRMPPPRGERKPARPQEGSRKPAPQAQKREPSRAPKPEGRSGKQEERTTRRAPDQAPARGRQGQGGRTTAVREGDGAERGSGEKD